jgi:hypothetical protein
MDTPPVSIADLFAARIAELAERSAATDHSIAHHLARAKRLIADLEAIDAIAE